MKKLLLILLFISVYVLIWIFAPISWGWKIAIAPLYIGVIVVILKDKEENHEGNNR